MGQSFLQKRSVGFEVDSWGKWKDSFLQVGVEALAVGYLSIFLWFRKRQINMATNTSCRAGPASTNRVLKKGFKNTY